MEKRNTTVLSISADPKEAQLITAAAQGAGESRSAWLMRIAMRECAKYAARHTQPKRRTSTEIIAAGGESVEGRQAALREIADANLHPARKTQR